MIMNTLELAENAELYDHHLNRELIGCAIEVHWNLGSGLSVEDFLIVEIRSVDAVLGLHQASYFQLLRVLVVNI